MLKATYYHPYQMHGSLGSSCAVADVQGDKATLWSPTQAVWYQRTTTALLLGLRPENVRVIFRRGSGCYGLNGADTVTYDAALLSQAVSKPVRVQLTRKDEIDDEIATLGEKMNALQNDRASIEEELADLLGIVRTNGAAPTSGRKCSRCGLVGPSVRTCPQKELEV